MAEFKKVNLELDHIFDQRTCRHFLNDVQSVFHCHHYATLYTQLSLDAGETELLAEVAEQNFHKMLKSYYCKNDITDINDRIEIACQYYGAIGLGKLEVIFIGPFSGEVKSEHSHVEKGWIAKWGKYDKPVNYIGCGYVSGMFSAILDEPVNTFKTKENKSIVMGDDFTLHTVVKK